MRISDRRKDPEWCTRYLQDNLDAYFPDGDRPNNMPLQYGLSFKLYPVFEHFDGVDYLYWGVVVRGVLLGYVDETREYTFRYATLATRLATDAEMALVESVKND